MVGGLERRCAWRRDPRQTLKEARDNLKDAISLMLEHVDVDEVPDSRVKVVREEIEV
jgi:predicted RNase H-like HicB family nuclease